MRSITAREIADSRGRPTLEVTVELESASGSASVPSGASTGSREAIELRDPDGRMGAAIAKVAEAERALEGKSLTQTELDRALVALDGTPNKSRLGGNTTVGVSLAFARAAAAAARMPLYAYIASLAGVAPALPCPMFNVINGGKHAAGVLSIQEFMFVPHGITGTERQVAAGVACTDALRVLLSERRVSAEMGDEGGFVPRFPAHEQATEQALELLTQAREKAGFAPEQVRVSLDAAASSFAAAAGYRLDGKDFTPQELLAWWAGLAQKHGILSIEDPFNEDAVEDFAALRAQTSALVVGDDLTTTSAAAIERAAAAGAIGAVIIKPNQVGTLSETVAAARAARAAGLILIASHRSGETSDTWIADVAVGLGAEFIKAGAPTRPERLAKYNRLIEIAAKLAVTA